MKENPADKINDTMWYFLQTGAQKADIQQLKEDVYDLIQLMTQKNSGTKKGS